MTESIELELLQPNVCLPAGEAVTVLLRVRNHAGLSADVKLEIQGQLSAMAKVEPGELRLDPGEARLARVRFQPREGGPTGPMPYAIAATSEAVDGPINAAFGLVDIHRRQPVPAAGSGSAVPRARTA